MSKYIVPMEIPKYCSNCPFGHLHYHHPFWKKEAYIDSFDEKLNNPDTYGYVCNIDFSENGKYTKVIRGKCKSEIKKPKWCKLKVVE
jgi:hypothetical protein|nr:MAG TPA: hypothetical protein [Caudoviricetes sp.]